MSAWSGATSYEQIQRQVATAIDDAVCAPSCSISTRPVVRTTGCFELSDYIYSVRSIKPVYAAANDIALSAAYAICERGQQGICDAHGAPGGVRRRVRAARGSIRLR